MQIHEWLKSIVKVMTRYSGQAVLFATVCLLGIASTIVSAGETAEDVFPLSDGDKIYSHYCAPCHGEKGDGKGFNAGNLDPRPAVHTDSVLMSRRRDKDLYEVIQGGGRAVGKSTLMPPWGGTLGADQIQELISHLRSLCVCEWH